MTKLRGLFSFVAVLGAFLLLACGGSSTGGSSGTMNVHLVDGPISGYQEINIHIKSVEISSSNGWVTLGTPDKTYNLLSLTGGISETLASGATLAAGHYGQMRLILGAGNTVKLADGSIQDLTVPSGLQTGVKLVVSFDVQAGTTSDVWIDFDAAHSIQIVQTGASDKFMLRPTVRAFDKLVTGSIHGTLTDGATSAGLAGAVVHAQTLDGSGNAGIARTTVTDANGTYTLDLLPVGYAYFVVSQPVVGTTTIQSYDAKTSDAFALSATTPVFTYNAAFTAATATGGVSGALTPVALTNESDAVNLLQTLATPTSGSHAFIVDTTMAVVGTATETYAFTHLPVGTYSAQAVRTLLNADGTSTVTRSTALPAIVTVGTTATVDLSL